MKFHIVTSLLVLISFTISMTNAINLRQGPRSALVRPGATVTLICDVDQKAGITVYWYRPETNEYLSHDRTIYTRVPADQRRRYSIIGDRAQDVFTLQISNVVLADDGTYQCGYANGLGRFNTLASARVTILIAPSEDSPLCYITTLNGDPKVRRVGDTVDMVCTSEGGNPIPDLTWFRGEEELEENEGLRYAVHRQILRPQDTNMKYTCLMRGPMTTTRRTCSIRPMDVPPEVQIEPSVNSVKVGSTATFTCALMSTNNIGVRGYSWNVEPLVTDMQQSSPGRMQLKHSDRVLEIQDIREEDANTLVTCQAQTTNGELLTGTSTLVILVEPTGMTTDSPDMTTVVSYGGDAMNTDETDWQRAMRPTQEGTEFPNIDERDGYDANDAGVTVGMKPKFPAFLTGRTFIMTSAAAGAFILILIIVIIVIVKVVRRRNGKRIPITTPVTVMEHGGTDAYATILEMKRKTGSTYKGSSTLPILKSERKIGLPDVMRGGSSLSLAARNATSRGQISERSPLYAKPEKIRNSKHGLFGDSKKDSLVESAEEPGVTESFKDSDQEKKAKEASNLNAEGLIYADLVLEDKEKSKRITTKKGTQYASIIPSGKP